MNEEYKIMIASGPDHEEVFAEIYFGEQFVALVSQEDGIGSMRIEFPDTNVREDMIVRKVNLKDFQEALHEAAKKLIG